jgi:hypothetical protein
MTNKVQKYEKLPVVIEAIQWNGQAFPEDIPAWLVKEHGTDGHIIIPENFDRESNNNSLFIKSLEGNMQLRPNDYLIRGIANELYPCKPEIFEKTYKLKD